MDPTQLQFMQEAATTATPNLMPGVYSPVTTGGTDMLLQLAELYQPATANPPVPDISPLAPLQLQQYGVFGSLAATAGNVFLTQAMQQQGILPMGNAGSYLQAQRAHSHLAMQRQVAQEVSQFDAASIFSTLRGGAAVAGLPFNRQQQQAARGLASTIASQMPTIAMFAPEFADLIAGQRGSVQAMASQMMDANRYRIDPNTGQMGYGTEANRELVSRVFSAMFSDDNLASMQGLRAGDVGQLYRQLSAEGLSGPMGSTRERTIQALQRAKEEGADLTAIGREQGVAIQAGQNLESLSNADLAKLRQNSSVKEKFSQADAQQVTSQLQSYVSSIAAMREVFGENGNPNAPVPLLVNSLKALTSGQMQKFDAQQLNTMVRDLQSMSQLSGKSIDQLVAMNQGANAANTAVLGQHGVHFNPAAVNLGVAAGMAFQQQGAATGFGALTREQTEQLSMNLFSRSLDSEMMNALGALRRVESAGGFAENAAGREMTAIMDAARNRDETYTYTDDNGKQITKRVPTTEREFLSVVGRGAVVGMDASDFNQMLGQRTSNTRALAADRELQLAAVSQQPAELTRLAKSQVSSALVHNQQIEAQIPRQRRAAVAAALSDAAVNAMNNMTAREYQDANQRNQSVADVILAEARNQGLQLSRDEALALADTSAGARETALQTIAGIDATAYATTYSRPAMQSREENQAIITARSGLNEAMSGLGPKGSLLQRAVTAIQKQGERGEAANLQTLFGDVLGVQNVEAAAELTPIMRDIQRLETDSRAAQSELHGATPEQRQVLQTKIREIHDELQAKVTQSQTVADSLGLLDRENQFNLADVAQGRTASRELEHLNRMAQVRTQAALGPVQETERQAAADTALTAADFRVLAAQERSQRVEAATQQANADIANMSEKARSVYDRAIAGGATEQLARQRVRQELEKQVQSVEEIAAEKQEAMGDTAKVSDLADSDARDAVIRGRRSNREIIPTAAELETRLTRLQGENDEQRKLSDTELQTLTSEQREQYDRKQAELRNRAEDELLAEKQLQAKGLLGETQTLADSPDKLADMPAELKARLRKAEPRQRARIVFDFLDQQQQEQFYGKDAADIANKRDAARAFLQQAEGKELAQQTEQNLGVLSELRREYLADPRAVTRGGVGGFLAAQASQDAEDQLQTLANKYYDGNVGNMLVSRGVAMTEKGIKTAAAEFQALSSKEKNTIALELEAAGMNIGGGQNLTEANYRHYLANKAVAAQKTMAESTETLAVAAGSTYEKMLQPTATTREMANELFAGKATDSQLEGLQALESAALLQDTDLAESGLDLKQLTTQIAAGKTIDTTEMTEKQRQLVKTAENMFTISTLSEDQIKAVEKMRKISDADISGDAEKIGVTEDEYRQMVSGQKPIDSSLLLFDSNEERQLAIREDDKLASDRAKLERARKLLAENPADVEARQEVQRQTDAVNAGETLRQGRMKKAGIDDVATYNKRLRSQGHVLLLEERRKEYAAQEDVLRKSGLDDAAIDQKMQAIAEVDTAFSAQADELRDRNLETDSLNVLASGLGKETAEERQAFAEKIDMSSPASAKNVEMLGNVLKQVDQLQFTGADEELPSVAKLDRLIDEYAKAETPEQRDEMAKKYNLAPSNLDRMMRQTEFLDAAGAEKVLDEKQIQKQLQAVSGRDVAGEVQSEEQRTLRLTGTLDVRGDITGTATISDVAGVYGSR